MTNEPQRTSGRRLSSESPLEIFDKACSKARDGKKGSIITNFSDPNQDGWASNERNHDRSIFGDKKS